MKVIMGKDKKDYLVVDDMEDMSSNDYGEDFICVGSSYLGLQGCLLSFWSADRLYINNNEVKNTGEVLCD